MRAEDAQERPRERLADDEHRDPEPDRHPQRLRGEPGRALVLPGAARPRDDGGRPVREEVEGRERAGEHDAGQAERGDLGPAEVADDRGVDEHVQRLRRERAERRQREPA